MPHKRARQTRTRPALPPSRKLRLYADEDVEEWAVEILRDHGVNVITAKDTGNLGKDDAFHAGFAKRKGRVILTHNAKDYMDNSKLPFQATGG